MTKDDIIRMAREAGATQYANRHLLDRPFTTFSPEALERFAALVAAAERKTCEVACAQAIEHAKDAEREACAKVCDAGAEQMLHAYKREGAGRCAVLIRKRGQTA